MTARNRRGKAPEAAEGNGQQVQGQGPEGQQAPEQPVGGGRRPPAAEFRIGRVKITVWENHSPEHGKWFSFVPTRSYRSGDQWKSASSFGVDDLLVLALLAEDCRRWAAEQLQRGQHPTTQQQPNGDGQPADIPF